jgi:hypothetical protein
MAISGHKTRAIFDRYHIVAPNDLAEASRKLDALAAEQKAVGHCMVPPAQRKSKTRILLRPMLSPACGLTELL